VMGERTPRSRSICDKTPTLRTTLKQLQERWASGRPPQGYLSPFGLKAHKEQWARTSSSRSIRRKDVQLKDGLKGTEGVIEVSSRSVGLENAHLKGNLSPLGLKTRTER